MEQIARITNTNPRQITLPAILDREDIVENGKSRRVLSTRMQAVILQPGGNNVSDAYVGELEKLTNGAGKAYRQLISTGTIRVLRAAAPQAATEVSKPEGVESPETLATMPDAMALAVIITEKSVENLTRWLGGLERRKNVKDAIKARISAVEAQ